MNDWHYAERHGILIRNFCIFRWLGGAKYLLDTDDAEPLYKLIFNDGDLRKAPDMVDKYVTVLGQELRGKFLIRVDSLHG